MYYGSGTVAHDVTHGRLEAFLDMALWSPSQKYDIISEI